MIELLTPSSLAAVIPFSLMSSCSYYKLTAFDYLAYRIPKVHISSDDEGGKEIELSDDPYECMRLNIENVPCIVTLCKVSPLADTKDVFLKSSIT